MTSLSNISTFLMKFKGKTWNLFFFLISKDLKKTHFILFYFLENSF